ncbi:hypothetical protein [Amycolatopsis tucumanensis]|nr:hypothetical protein [Amycolatopsis tucumanensis]MCF6421408.1 hypothetical protein [Amycolatopsis tucumanensis]
MATDAVDITGNGPKPRTTTVDLPFVHAEFRAPELHLPRVPTPRVPMPNRSELTSALGTVRSFLPPPRQLAYYGALGVMAAVELIEWPVAVAIGLGAAMAGRGAQPSAVKPADTTTTPKPGGPAQVTAPAEPAKPVAATAPAPQATPAAPAMQQKSRAAANRATPAGQPVPAGAPRPVPPRRSKSTRQGSGAAADGM